MDDEKEYVGGGSSFLSHMFSLNPNEKNDLLNMIQYVLLAIIPVIVIN